MTGQWGHGLAISAVMSWAPAAVYVFVGFSYCVGTVGVLHVTERVMGTRGNKMASKRGCMCTKYFLKNISDLLVAG